MAWDTNTADYLAAPSGKPVGAGNDVMVFGSALPPELASFGYAAAFVTYHSAYSSTASLPQVKYFYQALYRSGTAAALDNGAVVVANASASQAGVVNVVDSKYMDTSTNTLQQYLSRGARIDQTGFIEVMGPNSGWRGLVNFANGYGSADHQVKRLSSGLVVMRGILTSVPSSPANGQKIAELSDMFLRPSAQIVVPVRTGTSAGVTGLAIGPSGIVTLDSGSSPMPAGYMYLNATWSAV